MTSVLLCGSQEFMEPWRQRLSAEPDLELHVWPEMGDLNDIRVALVADLQPGVLVGLPNLVAVQSIWAGIEHVLGDESFPRHVPIVRMVSADLAQAVSEYVTGHVFRFHLQTHKFEANMESGSWAPKSRPLAGGRKVGILGLGFLGEVIARKLAESGFVVSGWSKTPKLIDGVQCFCGEDALEKVLERSEILVGLLPLTPATRHLLTMNRLARLPADACFINVGRGELIEDSVLLEALDQGLIAGATLDVFESEPLQNDHPFWHHPKVLVTPHIANSRQFSYLYSTVRRNLTYIAANNNVNGLKGVTWFEADSEPAEVCRATPTSETHSVNPRTNRN